MAFEEEWGISGKLILLYRVHGRHIEEAYGGGSSPWHKMHL